MAKQQTPQAEAPEAKTEAPAEAAPPISFEEPVAALAEGVAFTDEQPPDFKNPEPVLTPRELEAIQKEAARENDKRDFFLKIHNARQPAPEPVHTPPALAPRMVDQLNAEIEAGRAMVAKNEARAPRAHHVQHPADGKVVPVFRPADYVPDQKKGQGHVNARTL
jgi:hypothetical protein